jgi:uncharacterized protein (TIGR01615 family)
MPQLFVVDPSFKEQFQLPNATPEYSALFQDLPNLFVGTAEQLVPIVELMCTQVCCKQHSAEGQHSRLIAHQSGSTSG